MKKAGVLNKKFTLFAIAFVVVAALVCAMLCNFGTAVSARAEDSEEKIFYYVDAGNFLKRDGSGERYPGRIDGNWGVASTVPTNFMKAYGLQFGTGSEGVYESGLYNSYTDGLYAADPATGKYWGITNPASTYGWDNWRILPTDSQNGLYDGYQTGRHTEGGEVTLTYKFEVDDATTPLKITIGARSYDNGGWGPTTYKYGINDLTAVDITAPADDKAHVSTELWSGQTITGVEEDGKYYVTLKIGEGAEKNTYLNWILISTANVELCETFVKKGSDKMNVTLGETTVETTLDAAAKTAVNEAAYLDRVGITATANGKKIYAAATVLPEHSYYFVNLGAGANGIMVADGAYSAETGYGYTTGTANSGKTFPGNSAYTDKPYDYSCRVDITSINYRFDNLVAGDYKVAVGVVEYWAQWDPSRPYQITANSGTTVEFTGPAKNLNTAKGVCSGTVEEDGSLTVEIKCVGKECVLTYILVYSDSHMLTAHEANDATCTDSGVKGAHWVCSTCGKKFMDADGTTEATGDDVEPALGHNYDYANGVWTWDGVTGATLAVTCARDNTHTDTLTAVITSEVTTAATCAAAGVRTYTATVTGNGTDYTDTKTEEIAALGHNMTHHDAVAPTCTENGNKEHYACSNCNKNYTDEAGTTEIADVTIAATHNLTAHEANDATCTDSGVKGAHWVCSVCGKKFMDANGTTEATGENVEAALGHNYDYANGEWTWTGVTGATLSVTCTRDNSHTDTIDAVITSEVTTAATEESEGVRTYTATVTVGGNTYTDTKTESIAKLEPSQPEPAPNGGCKSVASADVAVVAIVILTAAAALLVLRKKANQAK